MNLRSKLGNSTYSRASRLPPRVSRSSSFTTEVGGETSGIGSRAFSGPLRATRAPSTLSLNSCLDDADQAISKLRKCVGCNVEWTVRKTLVHKKTHIKKCAKKNRLTSETLTFLINQEMECASQATRQGVDQEASANGSLKNPGHESTAPLITMLGGVVKGSETHQVNRRRKDTRVFVKAISETRATIISKAELLLNDTRTTGLPNDTLNKSNASRKAPLLQTDSVGRSSTDFASNCPPPLTQAFSKSNLGRNVLAGPSLFDMEDESDEPCRYIFRIVFSPHPAHHGLTELVHPCNQLVQYRLRLAIKKRKI